MEMTYVLEVCPSLAGSFTVVHRDFAIRSLNGFRSDDPQVAKGLQEVELLSAAIPVFVIGADGRFRDVLGIDVMLKRLRSVYDRERVDRMEQALRNEAAMTILKQAIAQRWSAWVETWLGIDWNQGAEQTLMTAAPPMDPSGSVNLATIVSYLGRTNPGVFKFSARSKVREAEFSKLMGGVNAAFDAGLSLSKVRGRGEFLAEVESAWPLVKPLWSHTRKTLEMEINGQWRREIEDHSYRFDWSWSERNKPTCPEPSTLN